MKTFTNKILVLFSLVALFTVQACKKDSIKSAKTDHPDAKQVVKAPEKFGYRLVTSNSVGLTTQEKEKLNIPNFKAYYNSETNSTLLINTNSVIGNPNSGQGPTYEFNSSESILSGQMSAVAPYLVDDTGSILNLGLVCVNECAWVLYYGSITTSINGVTWIGSDFGSFKLRSSDGGYDFRKYSMDKAIEADPVGWIVETDRYN